MLDDSAALAEDAVLGTSEDWESLLGLDSMEDALDFLDDDIFEEQVLCFSLHESHGAKKMSLHGAVLCYCPESSPAAGSILPALALALHTQPTRCAHSCIRSSCLLISTSA